MYEIKDRTKDARKAAGDFQQQAGNLASSAVDQAKGAADTAMGYVREGAERAKELGTTAADMAKSAYAKTSDAAQYATEEMSTMIRRYPFSSILVGLGIGAGLGFLIGCSMRKK
jgi:uncharacterized protein YjbJ (UPF0337 family)